MGAPAEQLLAGCFHQGPLRKTELRTENAAVLVVRVVVLLDALRKAAGGVVDVAVRIASGTAHLHSLLNRIILGDAAVRIHASIADNHRHAAVSIGDLDRAVGATFGMAISKRGHFGQLPVCLIFRRTENALRRISCNRLPVGSPADGWLSRCALFGRLSAGVRAAYALILRGAVRNHARRAGHLCMSPEAQDREKEQEAKRPEHLHR